MPGRVFQMPVSKLGITMLVIKANVEPFVFGFCPLSNKLFDFPSAGDILSFSTATDSDDNATSQTTAMDAVTIVMLYDWITDGTIPVYAANDQIMSVDAGRFVEFAVARPVSVA